MVDGLLTELMEQRSSITSWMSEVTVAADYRLQS